MTNRFHIVATFSFATAVSVFTFGDAVRGDLIRLRNGGELRGTIAQKRDVVESDRLEIVTLSGARITVARDDVQFVARRRLVVEVYETRARQTPNTAAAQWNLAEWCRQQGASLRHERETHLRRIVQLEPEHKDAHAALKHTKRDGVWMTHDEYRRAEGYVKYKGRYITPQALELIEKTKADLEAEQAWYKQVRLWKGWLTGRNRRRQAEGLAQLTAIKEPHAVAALKQNFNEESNAQLRQFYVKILSGIPGDKPVPALVDRVLFDTNHEIRYQAVNSLTSEQYPAATKIFVRGLGNESNQVVLRAARGLGRVADEKVVPDLVAALTTSHRYRLRVPVKGGTLSFGSDGSFANPGQTALPPDVEALLRGGQYPNGVIVNNPSINQLKRTKIVKVKYDHQNADVLAALQKLTGANHGYNERNWRLWWTAKKNGTASSVKSP